MTEAVIELSGITRSFQLGDVEVKALRGVDLRIDRGEFVAIMGSSGSGKSTLMNIIGCLDRPTAGRYVFEGRDVEDLSEPQLASVRSQRIGFVFQSFNLLPRTSALENVVLPLLYGPGVTLDSRTRNARSRSMLTAFGLGDRERSTPNQLSGGQQQRVALARALINEPAVLLADEPTGNLDTHTSHEILEIIRKLNREHSLTVILVTHEKDIAAYASRVVTMRDGEIVSDVKNHEAASDGDAAASVASGLAKWPEALPQHDDSGLGGAFLGMIVTAAAQALLRNRLRSALTALGVFIGVAALIAMVAVGDGASAAVKKQLESLGTNMVVVVPGATTAGGVRSGAGSRSSLTVNDARAIQREDPAVVQVGWITRQSGQAVYGDQNWTTGIQGVSPSYPGIVSWRIQTGRMFTEAEDAADATVCLIGQTVYKNLFASGENPVGAVILVKGVPMRVVGLLASKGQTGFGQDQDDLIMIPFGTAERKVLGVASPQSAQNQVSANFPPAPNVFGVNPRITGYVNSVYVQAASQAQVQDAIDQATATLARRHHIAPGHDNDFSVRNLSQIAEAQQGSSRIMSALLAVVASISLIVGGIGIMNILLVSVTERTREIGVRMAIGARRLQVMLQFLVESVMLSLGGGLAGIAAGVGVSLGISAVAHWPVQISVPAALGGFAFSAAVGVFFGWYPARKAASLDPIEALHYE